MFIFDLVWGAAQIVLAAGIGLFVYRDYRKGFPKSRAILKKAENAVLRLTGQVNNDPTSKAEEAVQKYARILGSLKEAVASIQASYQQNSRLAQEQHKLSRDFRTIEEMALRKGDEVAAAQAAIAKINCEKRAVMFAENAKKQFTAAKMLLEELDGVEAEFEIIKTQSETIRVQYEIAEANKQLYALISQVESKAGLTPRGEMDKLLLATEHAQLQSEALLDITYNRGSGVMNKFMEDATVRAEIEDARKRIALPAPEKETNEIENEEIKFVHQSEGPEE
ncbi:hypothetical protein A2W60_01050 [Candidatus Azambacteria bacterium RIFCSPHIGHO2_02_46_12]|uniref:Uncharacterized protein n=1 Tax=Candidatus Azambacteria bacterium RIFCSPHIGHO2_02_46_12 TaxID=1797295 RepID=A0A1F5BK93_9BACT|nr:MAG: hypothetical protein A2W60_01050 [Candidatus Azambacteria bacterium RIFCSPHIGHO2_02_46_12]